MCMQSNGLICDNWFGRPANTENFSEWSHEEHSVVESRRHLERGVGGDVNKNTDWKSL